MKVSSDSTRCTTRVIEAKRIWVFGAMRKKETFAQKRQRGVRKRIAHNHASVTGNIDIGVPIVGFII